MKGEREPGLARPACFSVLNLAGAGGTYQVETRIQCGAFLKVP